MAVLRERSGRERRVAIVPAEVSRLRSAGIDTVVEAGAGEAAGFGDGSYAEAGASVVGGRPAALAGAALVAMLGPPSPEEAKELPEGCALVSFLPPAWCLEAIEQLRRAGVASFSFNLVPRTSRAQAMDALSSQASVAGYQAVVLGAGRLGRMLPMMMTAAGTIPPSRVLVIGAGVAGLQAIATSRKLGAAVSAYDVRPAAAEEIRSLGATPIELPIVAEEGQGGYAAEQSADFAARQQELMASAVAGSDLVVTTAAVPGRPAPRIVSAAMVEAMRPGSVIVDLASASGGNCELTVDGQDVTRHGVLIVSGGDLASQVPATASALYARNVSNMAKLLVRDGVLSPDFDDDIVAATCVTEGGSVRHEPTRSMMEGNPQ